MQAHGEGIERVKVRTDEWRKKYDEECAAHQMTLANFNAETQNREKDGLVADALRRAGMNSVAVAKALEYYDRGVIECVGGVLADEDAVVTRFKSEWGPFFSETKTVSAADVGVVVGDVNQCDLFLKGFNRV
jgi:hypothetical protein